MDIRALFGPRRHYSRAGGRSSIDLSDSIQGKENRLKRVREQQTLDRETIYIEGELSCQMRAYLDSPVTFRLVTDEELKELNR